MPDRNLVVLVDAGGRPLETAEKVGAHAPPGRLHLAFSVFLFRTDGSLLLQQRAEAKYHFAGVWANTCCSHPEPGEDVVTSAQRRVREELGLSCELTEAGVFTYRAADAGSGLVEHEYDHVLVGETDGAGLAPDPEEVSAVRFADPNELRAAGPGDGFAPWFAPALEIALRGRPARTERA